MSSNSFLDLIKSQRSESKIPKFKSVTSYRSSSVGYILVLYTSLYAFRLVYNYYYPIIIGIYCQQKKIKKKIKKVLDI